MEWVSNYQHQKYRDDDCTCLNRRIVLMIQWTGTWTSHFRNVERLLLTHTDVDGMSVEHMTEVLSPLKYDIHHDMVRSCCMTWVPCSWGRCRRARRRRCEGYRSSNNSTRPDAATAAEARTPNKAADKRRGGNVHIIISIAVFTYWLSTDSDLKGGSISYHTLLFVGEEGDKYMELCEYMVI